MGSSPIPGSLRWGVHGGGETPVVARLEDSAADRHGAARRARGVREETDDARTGARGEGGPGHGREPGHRRGDRRAVRPRGGRPSSSRRARSTRRRAGSRARSTRPSRGSATHGGTAVAIAADVSDPADRERLVAEAVDEAGPIDVLVNNAAVTYFVPVAEFTAKRLQLMLRRAGRRPAAPRPARAPVDGGARPGLDPQRLLDRRTAPAPRARTPSAARSAAPSTACARPPSSGSRRGSRPRSTPTTSRSTRCRPTASSRPRAPSSTTSCAPTTPSTSSTPT